MLLLLIQITYERDVRPILREHCFSCHDATERKADLDMTSYGRLMAGSSAGRIVASGDPGDSRLWSAIDHEVEPYMPPQKPKIADAQLAVIRAWIEGGLLENDGSKPVARAPKQSLALATPSVGRPDGPPPMPRDVLLEPVVVAERAGAVVAVDASPWAPLVAIGGQRQIVLYDTTNAQLAGILPFPEGVPRVVRFSRNGALLLGAGGEGAKSGTAVLWDVRSGERVAQVGDELDEALAADVSSDQALVALGGPRKVVRVFATGGDVAYEITKHTDWITAVAFSPDAVLLATADRNGGLHVWEADGGGAFYDLRGHTAAVTAVSWRPDSNVLASASEDGTIRLWSMADGSQIRAWNSHGGVLDVRYGHDGRLVTCGRDHIVRIWTEDGKEQRAFAPLPEMALQAAFAQNGVVAGDLAGNARILDGAELSPNPPAIATRLAALGDGDTPQLPSLRAELERVTARRAELKPADVAEPLPELEARLKAATLEERAAGFEAQSVRALVASLMTAADQAADAAKRDASLQQAADLARRAAEAAGGTLKRAEETAAAAAARLAEASALADGKRAAIEDVSLSQRQTELEAAIAPLRELARWRAADLLTKLTAARAELASRVEAFEASPSSEPLERAVTEARAALDGADDESRAALETALADAERRLAEVDETRLQREFAAFKAEERVEALRREYEAAPR